MAKILKWAMVGVAAVLLLVVVVAILLQQWLRTDDFRTRVEREASAALGVPVKLGRLSIDLWPLPAVAVDDVQLQTRPALTVGRVEARPSYAPLLHGRLEIATLIVRKAVLPQPAITAIAAAVQKKAARGPKAAPAPAADATRSTMDMLPRRAVFDDITWIDQKGQRITADAEMDLASDGMLREALDCYDDGTIEDGDLSVIGLALEQFHHAVTDRRVVLMDGLPQAGRTLFANLQFRL